MSWQSESGICADPAVKTVGAMGVSGEVEGGRERERD